MGQDWEYQNFSLLSHRPARGGGEKATGACEVKLIEDSDFEGTQKDPGKIRSLANKVARIVSLYSCTSGPRLRSQSKGLGNIFTC